MPSLRLRPLICRPPVAMVPPQWPTKSSKKRRARRHKARHRARRSITPRSAPSWSASCWRHSSRRWSRPSSRRRCRPWGARSPTPRTCRWVVTAYLLAATAVTPLFGKLSDIHGRRVMMLIAIVIFIAGSVVCALAPNMPVLIAGRALQGIGGGGILPLVHTIIGDLVSPREPRALPGLHRGDVHRRVDRRAAARRHADRLCALDLDLLDQPAARALGIGAHGSLSAPAAAERPAAQARRVRRGADGVCRRWR